jgi:molybdenum cofactor sulfurtransferase
MMHHDIAAFLEAYPAYGETAAIDDLRAREFSRLDARGQVYLDYTGSGLYAESQVRRHADLLIREVLGNPHSANPTSRLATDLVERARDRVLAYFNAPPGDYHVVFTANASQALKLVAESYPFEHGGRFLLTFDNHNSVNGIREFARARGASVTYVPVRPPDMRLDEEALGSQVAAAVDGQANLFAYPAQSNFSGVQHPLAWVERAQASGWDVLLDAAAFVPTNRLDLSRWHPDFVVLSFYKMFGYPTGVGALLARPAALGKLRRPWFAGGTITVASVGADKYYLASGSPAFEDGTVNFLNLPALELGFDLLDGIGIDVVHERVRALCGWLVDSLVALRHSTGLPMVRIYGPITGEARGGTVTLNFHDSRGQFIDHQLIELGAAERSISIRGGCFCNPGAGEIALGLSAGEISQCFARSHERMTYNDFRRCIDNKSSGAVRLSLGLASNYADVAAFLAYARTLLA